MTSEQKTGKSEKDVHDSLENVIRQAIVKDSFQSFSTASDYRRQWSQSFPALEQGASKFSKGQKVDGPDRKDWPPEYCNGVSSFASETNGIKDSLHPLSSLRGGGISVKGTKNPSENMQSFKLPEAVVAFAQAAAKTNGEPEKYLHGWPLMSPPQMQKCDKCSREFCSFINYRRHIRVHRRSLNVDKDSAKNRDFLGAFWDKLSLDEAKEIVSFKDVVLEEVAGSSIIKALASYTRKLGFSSLPHVYVKAGAALLDVVQARPPRFPISSQEFFSILDDASEKTFLCAGTALSVQKFVFDGDAGKIGLEMKNLVACTSFLVEQKLVKAWIADKDAEALRCQKLLVEEEEAAQKRQAELMERKRLKKLRQKEQRAREQIDGDKANINVSSYTADCGSSAEMSNLPSESGLNSADVSSNSVPLPPPMPAQYLDAVAEVGVVCDLKHGDTDMDGSADLASSQNVDAQAHFQHRESQQKITVARRSSPKLSRNNPNGFHPVQIPALKSVAVQKHNYRDQRSASSSNGHKVWTPKTKLGGEEEASNVRGLIETGDQLDQSSCSEVLIGSISVMLGERGSPQQDDFSAPALDHSVADHQNLRRNSAQVKHVKPDASQNVVERSMVKLWRPVSRHDIGGPVVVQGNKRDDRVDGISENAVDLSSESPVVCSSSDDSSSGCKDSLTVAANGALTDLRISSCVATAKAFLEQRWKGALAVGLVLSSKAEPPDCHENLGSRSVAAVLSPPSEGCVQSASSNTENQLAGVGPAMPIAATAGSTPKFRAKAEKGSRLKYVPKQRTRS
eukprot:TRINITY_DN38558_c0_g1_i6.p1 TRINITY_DN38558_c0_g1~~TRINITY_DN38558_c0_g1_i6.p1  ORF type:complete len:794 (-),score=229.05 TRINITY_DN38558_c0_g1_i6:491-2872(-)